MYLLVNHANRYIDEKGVNKYLIFDSTEKNKELLKKYVDVWNGIIDKIKEISSDECDYEKDYMKIKFNSDDDLPLNKQLEFYKHVSSFLITLTSLLNTWPNFSNYWSSFWFFLKVSKAQRISVLKTRLCVLKQILDRTFCRRKL